ncbi:MAG: hypothetical protein QNL62_22505 [Gammaproteobacteria bacterium]|nr:hypothetical protein [Gammaproteobacteria bacterium]
MSYFEARIYYGTIRKLKSGNYQVQIRLSGLKPITKTFPTKTLATSFQRKVEGDKKLQLALGDPGTSGITLSELIDEYMKLYQGKDHGLPTSLTWWKNYCGELVINKCTVPVIRKGINELAEGYVLRYLMSITLSGQVNCHLTLEVTVEEKQKERRKNLDVNVVVPQLTVTKQTYPVSLNLVKNIII